MVGSFNCWIYLEIRLWNTKKNIVKVQRKLSKTVSYPSLKVLSPSKLSCYWRGSPPGSLLCKLSIIFSSSLTPHLLPIPVSCQILPFLIPQHLSHVFPLVHSYRASSPLACTILTASYLVSLTQVHLLHKSSSTQPPKWFIFLKCRFNHVLLMFNKPQWLPVASRIKHKLLYLIFTSLTQMPHL